MEVMKEQILSQKLHVDWLDSGSGSTMKYVVHMGIAEREYMRGDGGGGNNLASLITKVIVVVISAVLTLFCLRIPFPIFAKIPMLIALPLLIRYLWSIPRKMDGEHFYKQGRQCEQRNQFDKAVWNYELAVQRLPANPFLSLRLLAAYHASGSIQKAQALIQDLEGSLFAESEVEELESLIGSYRAAAFEKVGDRYRLTLGLIRTPPDPA